MRPALILCTLSLVCSLAVCANAHAQSDANPLDWSEYEQKLWDWPFEETGFRVERKGFDIYQITNVREAPEVVYKRLSEMRQQNIALHPDYQIAGEVYSPLDNSYQISFLKRNLQLLLRVTPDPAGGSELSMLTTPMPHINAYFKLSLYDYRLGNNERASFYRTDGQSY